MPESKSANVSLPRRKTLRLLAATGVLLQPCWAYAEDRVAAARARIAALVGERTVASTGITLTTPAIAENGNTVPISVSVESPFTAEDYVKAVHIIAEENPFPDVISFYYTPASGRASNSTRIRLAKTQNVVALAELSDGRILQTANEVKVTIGGCGG